MKRLLLTAVAALLICWPALAQEYGVGANIDAGPVEPHNMNLDIMWPEDGGFGAWDSWGINPTDFLWQGPTERTDYNIWSDMRVRYAPDTLYLFMNISRWDGHEYVFPENNPWEGDHILIGIDPTLDGDDAVDDSWAGWPMNAPDNGPYVLKISHSQGITLNWGIDGAPDPVEEGWVRGNVVRFDDEWEGVTYKYFGVRLAIYVPGLEADSQIGFNVGGSFSASGEAGDNNNWFAWRPTQADYDEGRYPRPPVAGHLQRYGDSYGTITALRPFVREHYGVGREFEVPYVQPGMVTIDGQLDPVWEDALPINLFALWEGAWANRPDPDIEHDTRIMWTDDTLYVFVEIADYQPLYFEEGNSWYGDHLQIGIDPTHAGDDQEDGGWGGWPWNAPADGPYTLKINYPKGVTLNWDNASWGNPVDPDTGWVRAHVWHEPDEFRWGIEAAIWVPGAAEHAQIGFNIGGANSNYYPAEPPEDVTMYFALAPTFDDFDEGRYPTEPVAGDIMRHAWSFVTLNLQGAVNVEHDHLADVPQQIALHQNYPNPFNPTTTIEYALPAAAHVQLEVYNLLGQRVAVLLEDFQLAGTQRVRWNATDLPSGMYMYRLTVDGNVAATKKMVLMK